MLNGWLGYANLKLGETLFMVFAQFAGFVSCILMFLYK